VPPGLLDRAAWTLLQAADVVAAPGPAPQADALRADGIPIQPLPGAAAADPAGWLLRRATGVAPTPVVWLGSPDGDPGLIDALAAATAERVLGGDPVPAVEIAVGSHDVPGARLLDLVALMDRLRSPGGCPWDARQTHRSLAPYLLEEAHEVLEAVESPRLADDPAPLVEELGDLLLQVVFHARIGEEHPDHPWSVDDVADGVVAKLVRRHPHVFGPDAPPPGVEPAETHHLESSWDRHKAAEKGRESAADGIPPGLPALAVTATLVGRARRAGLSVPELLPHPAPGPGTGDRLLLLAAELAAGGADPEQLLREANRRLADAVREAEAAASRPPPREPTSDP
jgi:XTP/dITP diphosphohydrolase